MYNFLFHFIIEAINKKKRNQAALPSFRWKQNRTWILILPFVLPWSLFKSEAGNNLAGPLCLTLLGGGIKAYLGVPFCYCINVVGGSEGCDPRRALISPLQALRQTPQGIFWDTCRHTGTAITVGHTRMGRAVQRHETAWNCVNSIRKINIYGLSEGGKKKSRWRRGIRRR